MWRCYAIRSMTSRATYIGATPRSRQRLLKHNSGRGARRTKGNRWCPILVVSGFLSKNECLSFESGWKRVCHHRKSLKYINWLFGTSLAYGTDQGWNRVLDLLEWLYRVRLETCKGIRRYRVNGTEPLHRLKIRVFLETNILRLPWPRTIIRCVKAGVPPAPRPRQSR